MSHRDVKLMSVLGNSFSCVNSKMKRIREDMELIISKRGLKS